MSVSNPQKTVAPGSIDCTGTALVTLGFDVSPGLMEDPADIILIMDRSYSMDLRRMFNARQAANQLLRTVADASGPAGTDTIGGGSRIGLVSFSAIATQDVPLTGDLVSLKNGIRALSAGGNTNHQAAFEAAEAALGPKGANRQIAVMFTDGLTTAGGDATPVTQRMKAAGVEIYCVGLLEDPAPLELWASAPFVDHVSYTSDANNLTELFQRVAARIVIPGAQDVVIREEVAPDFRITAVRSASHGVAQLTGPRTLTWTLDQLGLTMAPTRVSLVFELLHTGPDGGMKAFNQSLSYEDRAGSSLTFPSPSIDVDCGGRDPELPEPCPAATAFTVPGCQDSLRVRLDSTRLLSLGRLVQLDVVLRSVCPGKQVAVSVLLTEVDGRGQRYPRGVKHFLVPAQEGADCQDIELACIPFSLPEVLNADGITDSICASRNFEAQVIANYVDTDFTCCGSGEPIVRRCTCRHCPDCCNQ